MELSNRHQLIRRSSSESSSLGLTLTLVCVVVFRPACSAQTSVCRHGELGPERLRGAEDLAGPRGVLLVLPDGADHGGRPRNLPSGKELWLKWKIHYKNVTRSQQGQQMSSNARF